MAPVRLGSTAVGANMKVLSSRLRAPADQSRRSIRERIGFGPARPFLLGGNELLNRFVSAAMSLFPIVSITNSRPIHARAIIGDRISAGGHTRPRRLRTVPSCTHLSQAWTDHEVA